ncbi:hypothetical protein F0P96_09750 [Hymenobacter busanensis]|uniref:Uncharacterized protein n=1 Tax=Hymenobacter busanensis TaxID=2607656 RepID=A0A7L4ZXT3_9BACT|nr:STAS/SEC14 domain-containing protein [Hymenobacter busanensis]KAA9333252.1 hypothetical protein F0P96_09750 [Hymenobacter busanensis]QHJ08071.1 hypothetical protein GUY19_12570 [Hymenobacter busanensis]
MPIPPLRFANAAAHVLADPEGFALMRWQPGPRTLADYQAAQNALLRIIRALGTGKALVDLRRMDPLSPDERAWVVAHWLPRAVVQGNYRYGAVLSTPTTAPWLRPEDKPLLDWPRAPTYHSFADEAEARAWLREQVVVQSKL